MPFPKAPRFVYKKAPLYEVSSQIRFPAILKIDSEPPASFQDLVRKQFPLYSVEQGGGVQSVPIKQGQTIRVSAPMGVKTHVFQTQKKDWILRLGFSELSLTCRSYSRWEEYSGFLKIGLDSLIAVYSPAFLTHVCVKYRNAIQKSAYSDADMPSWALFIQPYALGALAKAENEIQAYQSKCTYSIPEGGKIETTLAIGKHRNIPEKAFLIDSHTFTDLPTEPKSALANLNGYRRIAGEFFRWCITDELHRRMEPGNPV